MGDFVIIHSTGRVAWVVLRTAPASFRETRRCYGIGSTVTPPLFIAFRSVGWHDGDGRAIGNATGNCLAPIPKVCRASQLLREFVNTSDRLLPLDLPVRSIRGVHRAGRGAGANVTVYPRPRRLSGWAYALDVAAMAWWRK